MKNKAYCLRIVLRILYSVISVKLAIWMRKVKKLRTIILDWCIRQLLMYTWLYTVNTYPMLRNSNTHFFQAWRHEKHPLFSPSDINGKKFIDHMSVSRIDQKYKLHSSQYRIQKLFSLINFLWPHFCHLR